MRTSLWCANRSKRSTASCERAWTYWCWETRLSHVLPMGRRLHPNNDHCGRVCTTLNPRFTNTNQSFELLPVRGHQVSNELAKAHGIMELVPKIPDRRRLERDRANTR